MSSEIAQKTRRWRRSFEFQKPDAPHPPLFDPTGAVDVCPNCKVALNPSGECGTHGRVPKMRSAVRNG